MNTLSKATVAVVIAGLAGCAANGPRQNTAAATGSDPCNATAAAIGGALIGALLAGKNNRGVGAVAGGAIATAGCMAVNYRAAQVKTAQQVNQEYLRRNGSLPEHATLVRYDTRFEPSDKIRAGGSSNLLSYIEVAQGSDGVRPKIEEEITLYGPDGKPLKTVRKQPNQGGSAGAFQGQFAFQMPEGVPQGVYPFKTALFLNGGQVSSSQAGLQVVLSTGGAMLASSR
jgi:hypothetical protein